MLVRKTNVTGLETKLRGRECKRLFYKMIKLYDLCAKIHMYVKLCKNVCYNSNNQKKARLK